jgi:hypothetical protein
MPGIEQYRVEFIAELLPGAEKELAAFASAVEELFGRAQARQSIEDWMSELELMDWPSADAAPDWRRLTIAAASRLAIRAQYPGFKNAAGFSTLICQVS